MFFIHTVQGALSPSISYLPVSAITPTAGMALALTGGLLTPVSGADKPEFVSLCERDVACEAGEAIPCMPVDNVIFETITDADLKGVKLGDKLSLSADGTTVTADKNGSAEVLYIEETAHGTICRVRFS